MVENGDAAPDFELPADDGSMLRLSALKGRPVVLYFYPKDDTPGCTLEAQDFSDFKKSFEAAGAEIIGISPDSVKSHDKFKCKYGLGFRLLSDEDKVAANAYGVWTEKSMFGKKYMGVERSTFLIGRSGRIVRSWRGVKVTGHAEEVLAAVKAGAD